MSKEQIEEMAKDLRQAEFWDVDEDCCDLELDRRKTAENLYNAGYLKQIKGEWKKVAEKYPRYVCTACNHLYNNKGYKYCPNCGARMKGGAE